MLARGKILVNMIENSAGIADNRTSQKELNVSAEIYGSLVSYCSPSNKKQDLWTSLNSVTS
jgi:hypothetical protein